MFVYFFVGTDMDVGHQCACRMLYLISYVGSFYRLEAKWVSECIRTFGVHTE